jgi:Skp family chaperone for outer membrane proteins
MTRLMILFAGVLSLAAALPAQIPIGFVDVERCLKEYKKAAEQREQMTTEIQEKMRSLQEEKRKIDALKENIDLYTPGSQEWLDLQKRIRLQAAQVELDGQALDFQFERKLAELITKLYDDVRREVKAVAEAKGLKLVMMYVSSSPKGRNKSEVESNILVRPVLYFEPGADITAEVVSRLNK